MNRDLETEHKINSNSALVQVHQYSSSTQRVHILSLVLVGEARVKGSSFHVVGGHDRGRHDWFLKKENMVCPTPRLCIFVLSYTFV